MKNPWIVFIAARLGLFALFLAIFLVLGFDWLYSALVSGALALAASLVFLQKQRDELSKEIYKMFGKDKNSATPDSDADLENKILDLEKDDRQPKGEK
jgi:cell division protein FtsL